MAYLADTRQSKWTSGWATLGCIRGDLAGGVADPPLTMRRLRGSWEFGGRYRILDKLVLRAGVELESETMRELQRNEEVLILELGLVLRSAEPRLRARVRTDTGELGWLTIEVPSSPPLLDSLNLLSQAAARPSLFGKPSIKRHSKPTRRITASGATEDEEAWEVGGKYRVLMKTSLRKEAELNSPIVGLLRLGTLVTVEEIRKVQWHPEMEGSLRLKVAFEPPSGTSCRSGWMSSTGNSGESLLDVRDQLEYQKLMGYQFAPPSPRTASSSMAAAPPPTATLRVVRLQRPRGGRSLGLAVDHSDGRTLLIQELSADGLLAEWNTSCDPAEQIHPGDRIVCVNGRSGDSRGLLEEMSSELLEFTLQRDDGSCGCGDGLAVGAGLGMGQRGSGPGLHAVAISEDDAGFFGRPAASPNSSSGERPPHVPWQVQSDQSTALAVPTPAAAAVEPAWESARHQRTRCQHLRLVRCRLLPLPQPMMPGGSLPLSQSHGDDYMGRQHR